MCKLLVGIKLKKDNNKFEQVLKLQEEELKTELHGISTMIVDNKNKVRVYRKMKKYQKVMNKIYSNVNDLKIVGIHTRTATSGVVNIENTHFFEVDDYLFAHNGIICDGYSEGVNTIGTGFYYRNYIDVGNPMCDSYRYFKKLSKPITKKILEQSIQKDSFYGVALLVDKKNKRMFIMSTRNFNAQTDLKSYLFFYSFEPRREETIKKWDFLGFRFYEEEEKTKTFNIGPGVYQIGFNRGIK